MPTCLLLLYDNLQTHFSHTLVVGAAAVPPGGASLSRQRCWIKCAINIELTLQREVSSNTFLYELLVIIAFIYLWYVAS